MLLRHRNQGTINRLRRMVTKYGCSVILLCLCVFMLCYPGVLIDQFRSLFTSTGEDAPENSRFDDDQTTQMAHVATQSVLEQRRVAAAFRKVANFPFISTERQCENLFAPTRRGSKLTYSASYWEFVDSYKNALSAAGALKEGRTNEESWTIHEIAKSSFVKTVCITGFNGGLSAFMCLTANPNLKVYAFDGHRYNYTKDLAMYMSLEFYDRFTITFGDTRQTIPEFITTRPAFRCDMFVVDGSRSRETLADDFKTIATLAKPSENIVIVELHATDDAARLWESYKERGDLKEHFMCKFSKLDVLSVRSQSHIGFAVGSYVNI